VGEVGDAVTYLETLLVFAGTLVAFALFCIIVAVFWGE
jgi:hypothetical protein